MSTQTIFLIVLIAYLLMLILVGLYFFYRSRNVSDYVLGSRNLNPWVAALSAQASDMSGWLFMGVPGMAYLLYEGTTEALWTAVGLFLGTYLNWLFVAKPLRRQTGNFNSLTLPEFFSKRFADKSHILRVITAVFVMLFFLFYTASMFSAAAKLFSTLFQINYTTGLLIGGAVIIFHTFMGGFLAVCWSDAIQGVWMFLALILVPIYGMYYMTRFGVSPDFNATSQTVFSLFPKLESGELNSLLLISALGWGLGYFGQPHILPRFMAIRSEKGIRPARVIATIWVIFTLATAVIIGVIGAKLFPNVEDSETIFIVMSMKMFNPWITGILLTAVMAAVMSTADSQLLVSASAATADIYQGVLNPKASEKAMLWISRVAVIVISVLAISLVYIENPTPGTWLAKINESLFKLVAFAWAGFGAAFGPIMLFSLFWKRTSWIAALMGVIVGGVTALIWRSLSGGLFDVYELVPGFLFSAVTIFVLSLLFPASPEVQTQFELGMKEEN